MGGLLDISVTEALLNLASLATAFVLALPIGWDREQHAKSLGMRTFPLVAMASCAFLLVGKSLAAGSPDAHARILQGTATGIGFLGGGAIVKEGVNVRGTATAAAIWATAALGAAVAYRRLEVAIVLAVACFATLRWMRGLKHVAKNEAGKSEQQRS